MEKSIAQNAIPEKTNKDPKPKTWEIFCPETTCKSCLQSLETNPQEIREQHTSSQMLVQIFGQLTRDKRPINKGAGALQYLRYIKQCWISMVCVVWITLFKRKVSNNGSSSYSLAIICKQDKAPYYFENQRNRTYPYNDNYILKLFLYVNNRRMVNGTSALKEQQREIVFLLIRSYLCRSSKM